MKKLLFLSFIFIAGLSFLIGGHSRAVPKIIDFEIEVEMKDTTKFDIEYDVKAPNKIEAKYAAPRSVTLHGKNAVEAIEPLFQQLQLEPNMNLETLKANVVSILKINEDSVDDFEMEVKFATGEKIKIEK